MKERPILTFVMLVQNRIQKLFTWKICTTKVFTKKMYSGHTSFQKTDGKIDSGAIKTEVEQDKGNAIKDGKDWQCRMRRVNPKNAGKLNKMPIKVEKIKSK